MIGATTGLVVVVIVVWASMVELSYGMGWIPESWLSVTDLWGWGIRMLKRYIVSQPLWKVSLVCMVACLVHTTLLSYFPASWMRWLRSDGTIGFMIGKGFAEHFDKQTHATRASPWRRTVMWLIEAAAMLCLLPLVIATRLAGEPANSRLVIAAVFAPMLVATAGWTLVEWFPTFASRILPEGFAETGGTGLARQNVVWVSAVLLLTTGAAFEVARRWLLPDLAEWFIGQTHPTAFLWGLCVAVGAALTLAGLHLDGNTYASPQVDADTGGPPLSDDAAQDGGADDDDALTPTKPAAPATQLAARLFTPLDPATVHLSMLFVATAAIAGLHLLLPVFNRREFCRIRMQRRMGDGGGDMVLVAPDDANKK